MSIFAPTDIETPIERRKALIQKLMGQYQASTQAANATQMPPGYDSGFSSGHVAESAAGRAFHGGNMIGPRTAVTNVNALNDISPDVRAHLGPGGFHIPLPFEQSHGVGAPVAPPALGINAPSQLPPGTTGAPGLSGNPGNPGVPGLPSLPAPAAGPASPAPAPIGNASTSGLSPLGNGLYFDPTTGTIMPMNGGPAAAMGQVALDLANGRSSNGRLVAS